MVKRLLQIVFGLTLWVPFAHSQAADQLFTATRQQLDVTKIVLRQQDAWNRGDLDAYLAFFKDAPDTVAILNGPVRGLPNIRSAYRINFPHADNMGKLEQTEVEVRALGDGFALVTGKYHLQRARKTGGDTEGSFTEIFEKVETTWRIVFSQTG